ncbi:hypothetical protein MBANPS3_001100 [Mucor bainieri]
MVSKELFLQILDDCAVDATFILYSLKSNVSIDDINGMYHELEASKRPLYGDSLFKHTDSLLKELDEDETLSKDDMTYIERIVSKIDLASFAFQIIQKKEYEGCVDSFFQLAVYPFNKYTKNEIQLFLSLRLYRLQRDMSANPNANTLDLINEHFLKNSEFYFRDDNSREKEAGRRQIMMAVDIVSEFLYSRAEDLNYNIRFGVPSVAEKFLRDFITYRLDQTFSCESNRENEKKFPETKDAMEDLVDQLFDTTFIDSIVKTKEGGEEYNPANEEEKDKTDQMQDDDNKLEQEAAPTHTPTSPPATFPKTIKRQKWTADETAALEEGLRTYKKRAWKQIREMFIDRLSLRSLQQVRSKGKGEAQRRRKYGLPLGGFDYYFNPVEDHVVEVPEGSNSEN